MTDRVEMIVKMQVTPAQALTLRAMFEHWNKMASWGCSRNISFYVDGDGNFHPKAEVILPKSVPELTDKMIEASSSDTAGDGSLSFDFDGIAWMLHD